MRTFITYVGFAALLSISSFLPAQQKTDTPLPKGMQRNEVEGIENFIQVSDRVFSGGEPTTVGLEKLKQLGITTILSVDGLDPDRETAEKLGMKYVHVPMGYDGIESSQLQDFSTLMANYQGKLFVHCHHGKHRGPAAVAACLLISKELSKAQALQYMRSAGTGKDYTGLWNSIENLDASSYKPQDFPKLLSQTRAKDMAQWMAELDRSWEIIQASQKNVDAKISSAQLVVIAEAFKESARYAQTAPNNQYGDQEHTRRMIQWLKEGEQKSHNIHQQLEAGAHEKARDLLKSLAQQCVDCHTEYRN